ncbi:MAG: hypothetical protein PT118_23880 [Aphanizomenon gracile PMC644.10]|nr:hypothetical protein [Aphanizomenon gracile PMC627.10]MDM3862791.1 hypothetical protein [Aphanizomenon gracile PMC644.10]
MKDEITSIFIFCPSALVIISAEMMLDCSSIPWPSHEFSISLDGFLHETPQDNFYLWLGLGIDDW